jgi:hypothetical protein
VAAWKRQGYTNEQIAAPLAGAPRAGERKRRLIRGLWQQEGPP